MYASKYTDSSNQIDADSKYGPVVNSAAWADEAAVAFKTVLRLTADFLTLSDLSAARSARSSPLAESPGLVVGLTSAETGTFDGQVTLTCALGAWVVQ